MIGDDYHATPDLQALTSGLVLARCQALAEDITARKEYRDVCMHVGRLLLTFDAQQLSNTIWAHAHLRHADSAVLPHLRCKQHFGVAALLESP